VQLGFASFLGEFSAEHCGLDLPSLAQKSLETRSKIDEGAKVKALGKKSAACGVIGLGHKSRTHVKQTLWILLLPIVGLWTTRRRHYGS
jgi:hypothetical protein